MSFKVAKRDIMKIKELSVQIQELIIAAGLSGITI